MYSALSLTLNNISKLIFDYIVHSYQLIKTKYFTQILSMHKQN